MRDVPFRADVVVVGAGPAGLTAAIAAAERGAHVLVCERQLEPARKLVASGGGRCNVTNAGREEEFVHAYGRQGRFILPAWRAMDNIHLRAWLADLGVKTVVLEGNRVFPVSECSEDVREALLRRGRRLGIHLALGTGVAEVRIEADAVVGVRLSSGRDITCRAVVLATGGKSRPDLGGTDLGYHLAQQAGHTITPLYPALVNLVTQETWPRECAGCVLEHVWVRGKMKRVVLHGSLLFTHDGISGPVAHDLSRFITGAVEDKQAVPIYVRLADPPHGTWEETFMEWRRTQGRKKVKNVLDGVLPQSVARVAVQETGIPEDRIMAELKREEEAKLKQFLEQAPLTVVGTGGFERAMVTQGGVSLKEVDPSTLQSRKVSGLFFAGEVLDLDGPTGGFNLQWAFSSGWLAGCSAAMFRACR